MNRAFQHLMIFMASLVFAGPAYCWIKPVSECYPLEKVDTASLIVKGKVSEIVDKGEAEIPTALLNKIVRPGFTESLRGRGLVAKFTVSKTLKGIPPNSPIEVHFFSVPMAPISQLSKSENAIVFLTQDNGKFYLLDDGKLLVLENPGSEEAPLSDPKQALQREFTALAKSPNSQEASVGVSCLGMMGDSGSMKTLKDLAAADDPRVRSRVNLHLIRHGDLSRVSDVVAMLRKTNINNAKAKSGVDQETTQNLALAVAALNHAQDRDTIAALMSLTNHQDKYVRRAAVLTLRQLKNSQSIPTLVQLLDDADPENQYSAVITLCEIANPGGRGCPSTILFKSNPKKYIAEWKTWWKKNKGRKQ